MVLYIYNYNMNQQKINKHAFTLVELIVVILILVILWTIAFISLQWYSRDARDSVRTSDMSRIKTSLELFQLNTWKYHITTDWVEITYSWTEVWTQWEFWVDTFNNVEKLDKIPTDPLTDKKYVYSTTNTRQEYQIAWINEWIELSLNNSVINKSFAWDKIATLNINWNYNAKLTKVNTWWIDYILALPSIISSTWATTVESIILNNMLAYDGYKNLPFQYINSSYNPLGESSALSLVNSNDYVVYSWDISLLYKSENQTLRKALLENLQNAYTWTTIISEWQIQSILLTDTTNASETELLSSSLVSNNLGWNIIANSNSNSSEVTDNSTITSSPTLESKTETSLDLLAWTFTDIDWVQNITIELYSDIWLSILIWTDSSWIFTWLNSWTNYYWVTKWEAYNLDNSSWEIKRSTWFSISTYSNPVIVSLLWTNNLTTANFTASSIYSNWAQDSSYWAPWAFDWYRFQAASSFLSWVWGRHWEWTWTSLAGSNTNQWIQVEFDQPKSITQFSIYPKSTYVVRMPKDIKIQYSNDWVSFTDHESFTLSQWENIDVSLSSATPSSNYIRLFMINNHDWNSYLQFDEFVLKWY